MSQLIRLGLLKKIKIKWIRIIGFHWPLRIWIWKKEKKEEKRGKKEEDKEVVADLA